MEETANKVLVVASREESRETAHVLLAGLSESGYAPQLCCAKDDEDEDPIGNIIPDVILSEEVECDPFSGVVFLDDGGNPKAARSLAKRANAEDVAVAGCGIRGCSILAETGLLKDKFVPAQLPEEMIKGAKPVRSPAVRSDNIVTCIDGCVDGFIILVIDALGGEIRRTITSAKEVSDAPINSCLVISRLSRWPEYWELAERLCRKNSSLMLADWRDIDAERRILSQYVQFSPSASAVSLVKSACGLPGKVWFKQTSIGTNETIAAVEALERAGCKNVNSSDAIKLAANKMRTAAALSGICEQGSFAEFGQNNLDDAVEELMKPGMRWAKPVDGSLGEKVMRVRGNGKTALLSRRVAGQPTHVVATKEVLKKALVRSFADRPFLVQDDLGAMRVGDTNFELRFLMRRAASGWKTSAELARGGILISNPSNNSPVVCFASQAAEMAFGKSGCEKLEKARALALAACVAFQASLKDPDEVGELGVDITFSGGEPRVIEVNSVPDLTFVEKAITGSSLLEPMAKMAGLEPPKVPSPNGEMEASRADVADALGPDPRSRLKYRRALERELAHQGIYPQGDGTVEIHYSHDKKKTDILGALRNLQADISFYAEKVKGASKRDPMSRHFSKILHWALYRFRVLRLFAKAVLGEPKEQVANSKGITKKADYAFDYTGEEYSYSDGTVPGPYSNVRVPTRVMQVREGDDWMEDLGALDPDMRSWLRRYLAAQENDPKSTDGCHKFLLLDKEHAPSPWSDYEHGEGHIPTRKQLMH